MKTEKLGDDLFKVTLSLFTWNVGKGLVNVILELQSRGKVITNIRSLPNTFRYVYLICTTDK